MHHSTFPNPFVQLQYHHHNLILLYHFDAIQIQLKSTILRSTYQTGKGKTYPEILVVILSHEMMFRYWKDSISKYNKG